MLSFPILTDSPAPQASREGVLVRWPKVTMTETERTLARRILARQWGNATPAQALLCLSLFPAARCSAPGVDPALCGYVIDTEDKAQVITHWRMNGSVKEANALIRLLDKDYGTADSERFFARVAWLVTADQKDIQAFLKTVGLPEAHGGRIQLPNKQGCRGFLKSAELFPYIPKKAPPSTPVDEDNITDLFGGN